MYLEHFGLREAPFRMTPDPRFLYLSPAHARAMAYMEYTLWNRDSFVLITGEIGSGKTTLIQKLLAELDPDKVTVASLCQTQLDATEFLQAMMAAFGIRAFKSRKVELLDALNRFFDEQHRRGRQVVVIVDEAQNLSREVLEEIRLLSALVVQRERVLNVVLCGQPELGAQLASPELEQLDQRIRLRFHLRALPDEELGPYLQHRLVVAGGADPDLFPQAVWPLIYRYTGGVPRLVNTLCDTVLLTAAVEGTRTIDAALVERAVEELALPPYEERARGAGEAPAPFARPMLRPRVNVKLDNLFLGEYALEKPYTFIGRLHSADVRLEGSRVSGLHALLFRCGTESWLIDLHSTNGTFVDGKRIGRHRLQHGDVFEVTRRYRFTYLEREDGQEAAESLAADTTGFQTRDEAGPVLREGTGA
ncbi:MAG: hypothetical protein KatS3mg121_0317 [Gammaproteobacteria bacterium]|nr:MAG: hypothetical protein KatS3mg121_0317 [Gammaproteobacteria bacterium]